VRSLVGPGAADGGVWASAVPNPSAVKIAHAQVVRTERKSKPYSFETRSHRLNFALRALSEGYQRRIVSLCFEKYVGKSMGASRGS
jgi:hypothetical protein